MERGRLGIHRAQMSAQDPCYCAGQSQFNFGKSELWEIANCVCVWLCVCVSIIIIIIFFALFCVIEVNLRKEKLKICACYKQQLEGGRGCLSHCAFIFEPFRADRRLIHFNPTPPPPTPHHPPPSGWWAWSPPSPVSPLQDEMTLGDARLKPRRLQASVSGDGAAEKWCVKTGEPNVHPQRQSRKGSRRFPLEENRCFVLVWFHPHASTLTFVLLFF